MNFLGLWVSEPYFRATAQKFMFFGSDELICNPQLLSKISLKRELHLISKFLYPKALNCAKQIKAVASHS